MAGKRDKSAQYAPIVVHVFRRYWTKGQTEFEFHRDSLVEAAKALRVARPDNLGDVIYTFRYRRPLPEDVTGTAPKGKAWIIEGAGRSRYRFRLVDVGGTTIRPREDIAATKIPDATPEIVSAYALGDEQALLAKVRYNRLIDVFLGLTTYSLQNHLRTYVKGMGQIEIDEIYIGVNRNGPSSSFPCRPREAPTNCLPYKPDKTWRAAKPNSMTWFAAPCRPSSWRTTQLLFSS